MSPTSFQSTRPVWGATSITCLSCLSLCVSIHAPRVGRDGQRTAMRNSWSRFNPRAPCGARLDVLLFGGFLFVVSIHAPRVGRDQAFPIKLYLHGSFNPRAPCGARRHHPQRNRLPSCFNPRAPCGARPNKFYHDSPPLCFNPRAPCGARQCRFCIGAGVGKFQSTRPVWGATAPLGGIYGNYMFQSTRPVWGATLYHRRDYPRDEVSIHAPRVGRDAGGFCGGHRNGGFNPRAPCGARLLHKHRCHHPQRFQSTRPVWGATAVDVVVRDITRVSIHAPRVGRDSRIFS